MDYQHLLVQRRDGVMVIALNRPDVLNSFNRPMADELVAALGDAAGDDGVRAVLLTGTGRGFCAGQDLAAVLPVEGQPAPDLGDVVRDQYNPVVRAIRTIEKPVVCAVNGVAAGAGANIAFACDIVVAAEDATFIQSFARVGLIPDSGGTFILPRIIGLHRATALTGEGDLLRCRCRRRLTRLRREWPRRREADDQCHRPEERGGSGEQQRHRILLQLVEWVVE